MTEVRARRRAYASFIIKILLVLIIPLQGLFYSYRTEWFSILLTFSSDYSIVLNPIYSLATGLFILSPCLIFEWHINSRPISNSIRRRAAVACILSWFLSFLLYLPISNQPQDGFVFLIGRGSNTYYNSVVYSPILAIAFFVILPLIYRETTLRSISKEHRDLSFRVITSILGKKFKRERILSGLLWFGLVFCPFMFFPTIYGWSNQILFVSFFYFIRAFGGGPVYGGLALVIAEFEFVAGVSISLPLTALVAALRFVFVRDIFRYQSGQITKSRLVSLAVLGDLLPSAVITLSALLTIPPGGFYLLFFPLPILPLIGFAFIRFSKVIPIKEELWQDYEHRMWFEKERVPELVEESIKVPITYLLASHIRKRLKE